jgi:predicted MPP superfamily phosphohydrolase
LKIRPISDVHLEFHYDLYDTTTLTPMARQHFDTVLPALPGDGDTVLVVAGDLATAVRPNRIVSFLTACLNRFGRVIYVLGNHEHYGYTFTETLKDITAALEAGLPAADFQRLFVAGNAVSSCQVDHVNFTCGTLWTDFNRGDHATKLACLDYMRDFSVIKAFDGRSGQEVLDQMADTHRWSTTAIKDTLAADKAAGLTSVVVTHHMPSSALIHPFYKVRPRDLLTNGAFASELDWLMKDYGPALWLYGHTHTPTDKQIYDTRCVCNPVGYPDERNIAERRYQPSLVLEL